MKSVISCVLLIALSPSTLAAEAQTTLKLEERYIESLKKNSEISPLGKDSFGDRIDLSNGSVRFQWTDIDIPGNGSLPVRLDRSLVVEAKFLGGGEDLGGFGVAGSIDIPFLRGIFMEDGWQVATNEGASNKRCSRFNAPPNSTHFKASDYWSGNWMHIPWLGTQSMLIASPSAPKGGGGAAPITTKQFWQFDCLEKTKNGYPGEAFLAVSPAGDKYYFDWVVSRKYSGMSKRYSNHGRNTAHINRQAIFFLATRVEDRHGNWVKYEYVGDRLVKIYANDGRSIDLVWNGKNISSATYSAGRWSYTYTNNAMIATQPDGAAWKYETAGALTIEPMPALPLYDVSLGPDGWPICPMPLPSEGQFGITVSHPSGAAASYRFEVMRHMMSNVPNTCNHFIDGSLSSVTWLSNPNFSDSFTLMEKRVKGAGIQDMTYRYAYEDAYGEFKYWCDKYPGTDVCQSSRWTEVRGPDGAYERHHYGMLYKINSGQLLKSELGTIAAGKAPVILKSVLNTYMPENIALTQAFPGRLGLTGNSQMDDLNSALLRPVTETTIIQDGRRFKTTVEAFDNFARPIRVRKESESMTP